MRAAAVEAEQAQQLAAVQETMQELGDDMLSAFALPADLSSDGVVAGGLGMPSLAAAESEVRPLLFANACVLSRYMLTLPCPCGRLQLEHTQAAVLALHTETASMLPRFGAATSRAQPGPLAPQASTFGVVSSAGRTDLPR